MKTNADTCTHCQLPIPPNDLIVDEIDGIKLQFCCRGCQGVYRIISGAGLKEFYAQRTWADKGLPEGVFDSVFTDRSLDSHVIICSETSAEIQMIIQGVQCSSCIWLLEKILSKDPGVIQFRINYGTHRALVKYNPQLTSPSTIFSKISALGYLPQPFSRDTAQQIAEREQKTLLIRFGTAAFLSMQLMGFSLALYGAYFHGIDMGMRQLLQYISAVLATPVVFYSGWPFLTGAWRSLKNRTVGMDVLISLGVCTAYIYSIISLVGGGEIYFDTCAMIITLILLGRLFESTARHRSIAGIDKLLKLAPDTATRLCNDSVEVVASSSLVPGDNILVRAGERFPVDSCIITGESELDESSITGEPLPVLRQRGDEVAAGTMNLTASLKLQVLKNTFL